MWKRAKVFEKYMHVANVHDVSKSEYKVWKGRHMLKYFANTQTVYIICIFSYSYISTFLLKRMVSWMLYRNNGLLLTTVMYVSQILGKQFIFLYSNSIRYCSSSCPHNMRLIFGFIYYFLIFFLGILTIPQYILPYRYYKKSYWLQKPIQQIVFWCYKKYHLEGWSHARKRKKTHVSSQNHFQLFQSTLLFKLHIFEKWFLIL